MVPLVGCDSAGADGRVPVQRLASPTTRCPPLGSCASTPSVATFTRRHLRAPWRDRPTGTPRDRSNRYARDEPRANAGRGVSGTICPPNGSASAIGDSACRPDRLCQVVRHNARRGPGTGTRDRPPEARPIHRDRRGAPPVSMSTQSRSARQYDGSRRDAIRAFSGTLGRFRDGRIAAACADERRTR